MKRSAENTRLPGFQRDHLPLWAKVRSIEKLPSAKASHYGLRGSTLRVQERVSFVSMRSASAARPVRHCGRRPRGWQDPDPKMAAPSEVDAPASGEGSGEGSCFGSWLDGRLEALGADRAVYGAYILGVLQEEEEEEKLDALQGILSAFLVRSPTHGWPAPVRALCPRPPPRVPEEWWVLPGRGLLFWSSGPWGRG